MTAVPYSRRLASPELRALIGRRFAECGALLLALAAVALLVALASYHPLDPSWNVAGPGPTRNLLGPPGAYLADALLQWFGAAGALPAMAMLAWAWRIAADRRRDRAGGGALLRVIGLLLAMPVLAAVLAGLPGPHGAALAWPTAGGPGGSVGTLLAGDAASVGRGLFGAHGGWVIGALGAALAVVLALLTLGLTLGEWRAAARGLCRAAATARRAATGAAWLLARVGAAGAWVIHRINGTRPRRMAAPDQPEDSAPAPRQAPGLSVPPAAPPAPAPRAASPTPPARAARRLTGKPDKPAEEPGWHFPPLDLLARAPGRAATGAQSRETLEATGRMLESVLADYGVQGRIVDHQPGPVVTLYELEPAPGIRAARVIGLADDVARSLSVTAVRIATVPGRNVIGIEVPNPKRETVYLSELLGAPEWLEDKGNLSLALGKNIGGTPVIADLARMPHLLVAGTTGSGKSVGINAMILSLLYRHSPDQCRLILIDPKMLELSVYEGIPHLMAPVVTEPAKAVVALKWTVREMERRYRAMSQLSVRNIGGYNQRVAEAAARGEIVNRRVQTGFDSETGKPVFEDQPLALEPLPFIVVVIDEMADLMMVAGKEIEAAVQRLAQMARAAGIHVVMATQRPSVDVITGTIKANFPTRISFTVISKFDSRTILGEQGAEQLLGQGDMLYMAGGGRIGRVHGPFVSDREVEEVVAFLREQGEPAYLEEVTEASDDAETPALSGIAGASDGEKSLFDQAVDVVAREGKASTSFIQRHLQIGYNRAAKLIEQMEKEGIVGPANHVGKREVLVRRPDDDD
jgi:S-DNA-T family DNA segregation ATPase FtsK/SpoIIIE